MTFPTLSDLCVF